MNVIGIDPGSRMWNVALMQDGLVVSEDCVPSDVVKENPWKILELIPGDIDLVSAPSGYGLPLKPVSEITDDDLFMITLKREDDVKKYLGLTGVLRLMLENSIPAYILPGVKHLPSVAGYKKVNKIDMGTADKVCSTAYALSGYKNYEEASFLLAEIGSVFTAYILVLGGKIVDGIGGSCSSFGTGSGGSIDAEIARLHRLEKDFDFVFSGGFDAVSKRLGADIAERVLVESAAGDIISLIFSNPEIFSITGKFPVILSGSRSSDGKFLTPFIKKIKNFENYLEIKFNIVQQDNASGAAAAGSAMIADGLTGGVFEELVDSFEIKKSSGSVLDFIAY